MKETSVTMLSGVRLSSASATNLDLIRTTGSHLKMKKNTAVLFHTVICVILHTVFSSFFEIIHPHCVEIQH